MKNKFKVLGNKAHIYLTNNQICIIDSKDLSICHKNYKGSWSAKLDKRSNSYYVYGSIKKDNGYKSILFHRYLLGLSEKKIIVDHKDHNPLNNSRENLRICTMQQNAANQKPQINKSSKYKGVSWVKSKRKWISKIKFNGVNIHLGQYDDEIEAAKSYELKAKELFGEFAYVGQVI